MIIDFHTHTFPDKIAAATIASLSEKGGIPAHTDGTKSGLMQSMKDNGIDFSVVLPVATKAEQVPNINKRVIADFPSYHQTGVLSFGAMHPDYPDYKQELEALKDAGVPGIKLHPDYQGVNIADDRNIQVIEEAERLGLYTTIHAGIDIGFPNQNLAAPKDIQTLVQAIHPKHLILAHMGGWMQWDDVAEYLTDSDLYFDCSFCLERMTKEQFFAILKQHGSEHILFGSDSPWSSQKETIQLVRSLGLPDKDLNNILGDNAARLLGLQPYA